MEVLALTGFLGIPLGVIIGKLAKSELPTIRGWLFFLKGALFGIVLLVALFQYINYFAILLIPASILFAGWLKKGTDIIILLIILLTRSDATIASLILLYGLPAGTLMIK
ncbi:hypothetical protein HY486_01065 [Candidatus Woesearchaeota archaeon]|nr:hypothetical protein [Candidatus Woesearchaeota archaeon]